MSGDTNGPRFDVVASTRRQFSGDQKRAIVTEVEDGATVSEVARRHNIHTSLLFRWRREFCGAPSAPSAVIKAEAKAATFLPVRVSAPAPSTEARSEPSREAAMIEIEFVTGRKLRVGVDVDIVLLKRLIAALEAA
jgi:transposase